MEKYLKIFLTIVVVVLSFWGFSRVMNAQEETKLQMGRVDFWQALGYYIGEILFVVGGIYAIYRIWKGNKF